MNNTTRKDLFYIDPRSIVIYEGFNSRRCFSRIDELAAQIESQGVLNPISVQEIKKGGEVRYRLIDGERRYRAVMLLLKKGVDIKRIPAIKLPISMSEEDLLIQQLQRNEGEQFTEYELGIFTKKMMDKCGYTIREVAEKVKKNEGVLSYAVQLLDLDPRVQELLRDNLISGANVRRVYQAHKGDEEGAVQELLHLQDCANERSKKSGKKEMLSLKDLEMDGKTILFKDSKRIREGLELLFKYIEKSGVENYNPYEIYDSLKEGKLINEVLSMNNTYRKAE